VEAMKLWFVAGWVFVQLSTPVAASPEHSSTKLVESSKQPRLGQQRLSKEKKRNVTINGQKFQLLSEQEDHWLLYDIETGQYCITLNQLVFVTGSLQQSLHQAGWTYQASEWQLLAKDTYRWSGSFPNLQKLRRQLKSVPETQLEWQIQYLPISTAEEK
jgi:hypothetical protein